MGNQSDKLSKIERIRNVCPKGAMQQLKTVRVELFLAIQDAELP